MYPSRMKTAIGITLYFFGFASLIAAIVMLYPEMSSGKVPDSIPLTEFALLLTVPVFWYTGRYFIREGNSMDSAGLDMTVGFIVAALTVVVYAHLGFTLLMGGTQPELFFIYMLIIFVLTPLFLKPIYYQNEDLLMIPAYAFVLFAVIFIIGLFFTGYFSKEGSFFIHFASFVYLITGFGYYLELKKSSNMEDSMFDFFIF